MSDKTEPPARQPSGKKLALALVGGLLAGAIGSQLWMQLATVPDPAPPAPPTSWMAPGNTPGSPGEAPRSPTPAVEARTPRPSPPERPTPPPSPEPTCLTLRSAAPDHRDAQGLPLPPGALARIGSGAFAFHGQVDQLAYLPDGEHLLARSFDGRLALFRVQDGSLVWIAGGLEPSGDFQLVPARGAVAVPACDGLVLLDALSGAELERWPMGESLEHFVVSPDGEAVVGLRAPGPQRTGTAIARWSLPTGTMTWSRPLTRGFGPLALSDDGARVATLVDGPGGRSSAWVWIDAATGAEVRRIDAAPHLRHGLRAHFLPGTHDLVTSQRETATEVLPADGGASRVLPLAGPQTWRGALSADGTLGMNRGGVVFGLETGDEVSRLGNLGVGANFFPNMTAAAFSPDGTELVAASDGILRFHLRPGRLLLPESPRRRNREYLLLPSGDLVLQGEDRRLERWAPPYLEASRFGPPLKPRTPLGAGQGDGAVTGWTRSQWLRLMPDAAEGIPLATLPDMSHEWLLASGAERMIHAPTQDRPQVQILEPRRAGPSAFPVEGEFLGRAVRQVSTDGRHLLLVGKTDLFLWDLASQSVVHELPRVFGGGLVPGRADLFWCRPADRIQGAARSASKSSQLWRIGDQEPLRDLPGNEDVAAALGDDWIVSIRPGDGTLVFHSLHGGQSYPLEDLELRHVDSARTTGDASRLVTAHEDGTLYVWDAAALLAAAGVPPSG